ncbi:MAG: alpha/beta hydrolase, partial [Deltaproteobacteria bacterium]|nr:alpha/beta hydrolase [Deltaproteobacteria bacterium]
MSSPIAPKKRNSTSFKWLILVGIAAIILFFLLREDSEQMMVWHTAELTEEFTEKKLGTIYSWEQYMRLEDRLFAELEQKVVAQTDTGKGFELNRYSEGSGTNPLSSVPNWNRSFELPADDPVGGLLLLHGMSDSPYSLRALGETFHKRGYWVIGIRLPGHGTAPSGLTDLSWKDMAGAVQLATDHIKAKTAGRPLHIIGYSTGAPLALDYTFDALKGKISPLPSSLILISPAIGIHPAAGLAGFKDQLSAFPGLDHLAWLSVQPEFDPYKYNSFATNAGNQVHLITRDVARRLTDWSRKNDPNKFPPVLTFQSAVDATVSVNAVLDQLLIPLNSENHELVLFDINRFAAKSALLVSDPGPLTTRLMAEKDLPFRLTLVTNKDPESLAVVAKSKPPFSSSHDAMSFLNHRWPEGVISLSHVALPFPPDDPLYGSKPPSEGSIAFLGQMAIKGERDLL